MSGTGTANLLWGPLENARTLLASCQTFQSLCGVASEDLGTPEAIAEVAAKIFCPMIAGESVVSARPFMVIDQGDEFSGELVSSSAFKPSGSIMLFIEAEVPSEYQDAPGDTPSQRTAKAESAHRWFMAVVGNILEEAFLLAIQPGYLSLSSASLRGGPSRPDEQARTAEGDFCQVLFMLKWGPQ